MRTHDPDDLPLDRTPSAFSSLGGPSGSGDNRLRPLIVGGAVLLILLAAGGWWMWKRRTAQAPPAAAAVATEAPVAAPPAPAAPPLPPVDQMDSMMRALISALSSRPELARWLATDDLIRQLAAAIDHASQGKSPARDFRMFAPSGPFGTARRGGVRAIDPASYRRYRPLVQLVTSIDASAVAKVYHTIQPRLNEAYRARGHAEGDVDRALRTALNILVDTPTLRDPIAVVEGSGARWKFADPAIEARPASQRQLLRMGSDNVEALLVWLRAFSSQLK